MKWMTTWFCDVQNMHHASNKSHFPQVNIERKCDEDVNEEKKKTLLATILLQLDFLLFLHLNPFQSLLGNSGVTQHSLYLCLLPLLPNLISLHSTSSCRKIKANFSQAIAHKIQMPLLFRWKLHVLWHLY